MLSNLMIDFCWYSEGREKKNREIVSWQEGPSRLLHSLGEMVEESKPWQGKNSTHWHLGIGRRGLMTDKFWLAWNSNQALQRARPRIHSSLSSADCKQNWALDWDSKELNVKCDIISCIFRCHAVSGASLRVTFNRTSQIWDRKTFSFVL